MPRLSLLAAAILPLAVLGGNQHHGSARRHSSIHAARGPAYTQTDYYKGNDFLTEWDFFSGSDPTNGVVNYLTKDDAVKKGLAYVQSDNTTVLAVDSTTQLSPGQNRDSVRIATKKKYSGGLFIADFWAAATGCGTWPAYWSVGPTWPDAGEIDIMEGVNGHGTNQMTLHTGDGCTLDNNTINQANANGNGGNQLFTANILGTQCRSSDGANAGCAFLDTDARSFGPAFNQAGGGVYAHLWDDSGIKIWHFARAEIPQDITAGNPNPASWPTPAANWRSATCDMQSHFHDHTLTIDTTLCGGWGESAYSQSTCPGTCAQAVADPNNFVDAKWKINYVAVYNGVTSN